MKSNQAFIQLAFCELLRFQKSCLVADALAALEHVIGEETAAELVKVIDSEDVPQ